MVIRLTSAATIIVLMIVAPMAQSAPGKMGHSARFIPTMPADVSTVTNFFKQSVYDPSNNKIGHILDFMVEKDGRITAAMVGVGGFLGIDEKTVVVPFDAFTVSKENNQRRLTLNSTKDALKSAPGFTYDRATAAWVTDKSVSTAAQKLPPLGIGTQPRE
jgi:sporulation protein YlmC with PRC-barrel domain